MERDLWQRDAPVAAGIRFPGKLGNRDSIRTSGTQTPVLRNRADTALLTSGRIARVEDAGFVGYPRQETGKPSPGRVDLMIHGMEI
jgi:hypothetical protein